MSSSWTAPRRPGNEVTQAYSDGIVTIYAVTDSAAPGMRPVERLTERVRLRYAERKLGIQRYYAGRQNQVEIERVIRVPRSKLVSTQDVAVTEDGRRYRIDMVQAAIDVYPPSADLTLVRIDQGVEVEHGDME